MPFTARYVFSLEDYKTLTSAVKSQSRFGLWPVRAIALAVMLLMWGVPYLQASLAGDPKRVALWPGLASDVLPIVLMYAVWEALMFRTSLVARLSFKQCSLAEKEVTYRLGETGVSFTTDSLRGEYDWPAVKSVIARPAAAVLLIGKRQGIVLPARAFASQEEFEAAANFARAKVAAEKSASGV